MVNNYVVWVDITHRIEVEAEDANDAHEQATWDVVWDETNMVDCKLTVETMDE